MKQKTNTIYNSAEDLSQGFASEDNVSVVA